MGTAVESGNEAGSGPGVVGMRPALPRLPPGRLHSHTRHTGCLSALWNLEDVGLNDSSLGSQLVALGKSVNLSEPHFLISAKLY